MRKMAHAGAWVDRMVEGEQSGCQGEKAWRISTGVGDFGGAEGVGTQAGGRGPGPGKRRARETAKRSQFGRGGWDRGWRNKANLERNAKRSQSGVSKGVPAGMYHRLQCSAR